MEYKRFLYWISASVLVFTFVSGALDKNTFSTDLEQELRETIFTNYSHLQRPSDRVSVKVSLHLLTLNTLDVKEQFASITAYFSLEWTDSRLGWSNYSGIRFLFSNENYVWRPALIVDNSVADFSVINDKHVPMRILGSGTVSWNPAGIYVFACDADISNYPFDEQTCALSLTSWAYTANEINLYGGDPAIDTSEYSANGEWDLVSARAEATSDGKTRGSYSFSNMKFYMTASRRSRFHVLNTLVPVILMAYLSALVFKLPADSGEKVGFSLTVLLAYAVYLTLISDNIPSTSVTVCLLSVYLTIILALGCVSVVLTILTLNVYHKPEEEEIPSWLRKFVKSFLMALALSKCCCKQRNRRVYNTGDKVKDAADAVPEHKGKSGLDRNKGPNGIVHSVVEPEDDTEDLTWQKISKIMDAAFFNIFFLLIFVSTLWFIINSLL